jgi:molybdate/tungstate transport system substrate-binding protein
MGAAALLAPSASSAATMPGGPVDVLSAGSLVDLMADVAPVFDHATGYKLSDFSMGSDALATEIKGKTQKADVFISASATVNAGLEGAANGNWVSWYASFGTTPLLIGYNPKSKFAHDLLTKPWYEVVTMPGFRLGRTDPATDPKGVLADEALDQAAKLYKVPALAKLTSVKSEVFPEETLVGRLEAGQLDAGFFYGVEAKSGGFPTISLGTIRLTAGYTITVVNRAPDQAGAIAFVQFLLGPKGAALLAKNGISLIKPAILSGSASLVPAQLKGFVS